MALNRRPSSDSPEGCNMRRNEEAYETETCNASLAAKRTLVNTFATSKAEITFVPSGCSNTLKALSMQDTWYGSGENLASFGFEHVKIYRENGQEAHYDRALQYLKMCFEYGGITERTRIRAGSEASKLLIERKRWPEAADLLAGCVQLLPRLASMRTDLESLQLVMENAQDLATTCAATIMNAIEGADRGDGSSDDGVKFTSHDALYHLELGRAVISSQALERLELGVLRLQNRHLAEQYESAKKELNAMSTAPDTTYGVYGNKNKYDSEIEERYNDVCRSIRETNGFERFLTNPTVAEMQEAARDGTIVVVNVTDIRSDAFLINKDEVRSLRLHHLSMTVVSALIYWIDYPEKVPSILECLWDCITEPILNALHFTSPSTEPSSEWPRIWWVPTGILSLLPLHAAGIHRPNSTQTVLDRVMSSYCFSVRWIVKSHQATAAANSSVSAASEPLKCDLTTAPNTALLVAMPKTPPGKSGQKINDLPNAEREIKSVAVELDRLGIRPVRLESNCHKACLAELRQCSVFHFAGHGHVDAGTPSQSYLLLDDWATKPLTMADLSSRMWEGEGEKNVADDADGTRNDVMQRPFLAYLSACDTAISQKVGIIDESIHLVSGMQLAGFSNVVGALRPVSDFYSNYVATAFYRALPADIISDKDVCRALHQAVRALRGENYRHSLQAQNKRHLTTTAPAATAGQVCDNITGIGLDSDAVGSDLRLTYSFDLNGNASRVDTNYWAAPGNWAFYVHFSS